MRGRILLVTGLAIGYVLGTRAGRERYEDIKAAAGKFWNSPRVQKNVHQAEDYVKEKAPEVAKSAVAKVTGSTKTTTPARKTTTRKTATSN
jgi:hypothetical protein